MYMYIEMNCTKVKNVVFQKEILKKLLCVESYISGRRSVVSCGHCGQFEASDNYASNELNKLYFNAKKLAERRICVHGRTNAKKVDTPQLCYASSGWDVKSLYRRSVIIKNFCNPKFNRVKLLINGQESDWMFPFGSCRRHFSVISDPENKGKSQLGVNFDTLGTWNNRISMPILMKESIKMGKLIPKIPLDKIGQATLLGRRLVNEDRFVIKSLSSDVLCFGVFDGHAGSIAATYLKDHMADHVTFWLSRTTDLDVVLQQSFIDINNSLSRNLYYYHLDTKNFNTGTTATVCLIRHGVELVVGHVGDSRAVLCRDGQPVRLSEDHHPERRDEAERVKKCGGFIVTDSLGVMQINGRLAMTRSIGDMELKHSGVIAKPELQSIKLKHGKDAFLLLASDGVSFVLSDQEIVDIVCSCSSPREAANFITDQALQFGSEDNATCLVIPLGAWGKYRNTTRSIPYSFGRNLVGQRYS